MARVLGSTAFPKQEQRKTKPRDLGKKGKLSRLRKPEEMELEEWQRQLRRQFGREQSFILKNLGAHPVFSEFQVTNPDNQNTYRVAIRGIQPGEVSGGYGLKNMRERVEALGGRLRIESPGTGTLIVVEVPAPPDPAGEPAPA